MRRCFPRTIQRKLHSMENSELSGRAWLFVRWIDNRAKTDAGADCIEMLKISEKQTIQRWNEDQSDSRWWSNFVEKSVRSVATGAHRPWSWASSPESESYGMRLHFCCLAWSWITCCRLSLYELSVLYLEILELYMEPSVHILLGSDHWIWQEDKASVHKSTQLHTRNRIHKVPTPQWPAQSQDLSPVRNVWWVPEYKGKNRMFQTSTKERPRARVAVCMKWTTFVVHQETFWFNSTSFFAWFSVRRVTWHGIKDHTLTRR